MKRAVLLFFVIIYFTSCSSTKKVLQDGEVLPSIASEDIIDIDDTLEREPPVYEQNGEEQTELIIAEKTGEAPAQAQEAAGQETVSIQPQSHPESPGLEPSTSNNQTGIPSRNIEAAGSLNQEDVIAYIRSQNPVLRNRDIEPVVQAYFKEAAIEGINHDIAIAQMLHATNFFKNRQRTASYNYAGFISTPGWSGSFKNMEEGVRAHIQHLKGYASRSPLSSPRVDPRYDLLNSLGYHGNVKTFDQLYKAWTQNSVNYGKNIDAKLEGLYLFSAVKR